MSEDYLGSAVDIARESGVLLADLFRRGTTTDGIQAKGRFDLATEADRTADTMIVDRLRAMFPSHTVIAEESGRHPGTSSLYRWHVDPLDGTKNFARGYPVFSVSLALERAGELVLGVVFDPLRDELFAAERGAGAFCNKRPISVSSVDRLERSLAATGFPSAARHPQPPPHSAGVRCGDPGAHVAAFHRICTSTQGIRRSGSSALDLSYVACGRLDLFWDIGLASWDLAAGLVLVSEAGGRHSDLRGAPYTTASPDVVADNALVHDAFVRVCGESLAAAP